MLYRRPFSCILPLLVVFVCWTGAYGQCPEEPPLQNYTGAGEVVCPCFVQGEEAGVILNLPPEDFPIEILRIGIGWSSQNGGAPDILEQSIHIYGTGLPDPGVPIFSLDGPQLSDGFINEFNLEPLAGEIIVDSGPFSVTLEFYNNNVNDPWAPSTIHDGNGCQSSKNLVYAIPGGWYDACVLGVSGDWVFYVIYRPVTCYEAGRVPDGNEVPGPPVQVEKFSGNLILSWDPSCITEDTDYEIYEGTIGDFTSHMPKLCSTGGATMALVAPPVEQSFGI